MVVAREIERGGRRERRHVMMMMTHGDINRRLINTANGKNDEVPWVPTRMRGISCMFRYCDIFA